MQHPVRSTTRVECWNYLTDENQTKSHDKLFQTLTIHSVKNADLTVLQQCLLNIYKGDHVYC